MTSAMAYVATFIVIPIVIAVLMFVGRKEMWRAIALFSVIAIIAEVINITLWILQVTHRLPYTSTDIIAPADGIRMLASGLSEYLGATAWVLCLLISAQRRRVIWAPVLVFLGIVSLVILYVVDHPYLFFPRSSYAFGHAILLAFLAHLTTIVTLIFSLVIRPQNATTSPQPAFYAPQPPAPEG